MFHQVLIFTLDEIFLFKTFKFTDLRLNKITLIANCCYPPQEAALQLHLKMFMF